MMHPSSFRDRRRPMQIHAVPESERAIDANGRKLPWAYDYTTELESREAAEKGPFGRSLGRSRSGYSLSRSRSITAQPEHGKDKSKIEQQAAEDQIFGSLRKVTKEDGRQVLGEVDGKTGAPLAATTAKPQAEQEATEVLLYGFGEDLEWSALDHYEKVSKGSILEDYHRGPSLQRYDISRSLPRAMSQQSLSKAALKKKNAFAGGNHWIKVTFDSRNAAELACARSPHIIKGHLVYAEPYQGRGPGRDESIPATQAGAQIDDPKLPLTFSTNALNASPGGSSNTASSATVTERRSSQPPNGASQTSTSSSRTLMSPIFQSQSNDLSAPVTTAIDRPSSTTTRQRSGRIEGAKAATVHPPSLALLPKQPKQSWTAWLGTGEIIGSTVPKKEDGTFDSDRASFYWLVFFWLDLWFGTDFCGLKGD